MGQRFAGTPIRPASCPGKARPTSCWLPRRYGPSMSRVTDLRERPPDRHRGVALERRQRPGTRPVSGTPRRSRGRPRSTRPALPPVPGERGDRPAARSRRSSSGSSTSSAGQRRLQLLVAGEAPRPSRRRRARTGARRGRSAARGASDRLRRRGRPAGSGHLAGPDAFALAVVDVSGEPDPEAAARRLVDEETARSFDLRGPGLFRARLLRLSATRPHPPRRRPPHRLRRVVEGRALPRARRPVRGVRCRPPARRSPEPRAPVRRLRRVAALPADRRGARGATSRYWAGELAGVPTALELPSDRPRPPVATLRGARRRLPAPSPTSPSRSTSSRQSRSDLLRRRPRPPGSARLQVHARERFRRRRARRQPRRPELDDTIGVLLEHRRHPQRPVRDADAFARCSSASGQRVHAAADHAELPFELLVRRLEPQRDPSRHPLFQVLLAINPPDPPLALQGLESASDRDGGDRCRRRPLPLPAGAGGRVRRPVGVQLGSLRPRDDRSDPRHFVQLLEPAVAAPDTSVDELPLLTDVGAAPGARRLARADGRDPEASAAPAGREQVPSARRAAVAVAFDGAELTYGELNARANQLARRLRAIGVRPDSLVAVGLERSIDLVVALLADPQGGRRLRPARPRLCRRTGSRSCSPTRERRCSSREERLRTRLPPFDGRVISIDRRPRGDRRRGARRAGTSRSSPTVSPTSSTRPARRERRRACSTRTAGSSTGCRRCRTTYRLGASDRLLQKTPISFDVSVREVFWPLLFGAPHRDRRVPGEQGNPATWPT